MRVKGFCSVFGICCRIGFMVGLGRLVFGCLWGVLVGFLVDPVAVVT